MNFYRYFTRSLFFITFLSTAMVSCESIKQSSKYGFNEGYYKSRIYHKKLKSVYVVPDDDSIKVYTVKSLAAPNADSIRSIKIAFPANKKPADFSEYFFRQGSLDVDVLTILLKYRPSIKGFPNQLNTSVLNGALYLGHRTDFFRLRYKKTPLSYKRSVTHYACSFGAFSGIGAAAVNEYVTRNAIDIEYDGFVNPTGIAAIFAVDKFTAGLTFGADHLLDKNKKFWIYQGKPWIGLSIGLNLN